MLLILVFAVAGPLSWPGLAMSVQAASAAASPTAKPAAQVAPVLQSEAAVLLDADSGQVLFGKNMDKKMYPASITKIMTALLTLEAGHLDDVMTMSGEAIYAVTRNSSHIALNVGEKISVRDALYALSIESANDAANGLAEHVGGSLADFATLMTARAAEAGARHTHFTNANGLPDKEHYTTAYDMAMITRQAVQIPEFLEIFSSTYHEIPATNKQPQTRKLHSANWFLTGIRPLEGVLASKTGYTNDARYTLVTVVRREERTLIAVVMKSAQQRDKWDDTTRLMQYGFNQFVPVTIPCSQITRQDVACTNETGQGGTAELTSTRDVTLLLHKSVQPEQVQIDYELPAALTPATVDQVRAVFHVPETFANVMYPTLASVPLAVQMHIQAPTPVITQSPAGTAAGSANQQPSVPDAAVTSRSRGLRLLSLIFMILGAVIVLLAIIVIVLALRARQQRRIRAMRRSQLVQNRIRYP